MDDNEIYMIIENIIENLKIIRTMHEDSIYVSKSKFEEVERNLIGRLVQEIDKKLKEIILNEEVDFLKNIKSHYYNVCSVCRYEDWPEFKEYLNYIDGPFYDGGLNIKEFLRSSFVKYKFPVEYIFDYYDNGWIRIKLAEFISKGGSGKVFGSSYEDYGR